MYLCPVQKQLSLQITIIGSGHVAHHFGRAFVGAGHRVVEVFSPTPTHARALARACHAQPIKKIQDLNTHSDLYLIAVKDDALPSVANQLPANLAGWVVHTSGSTDLAVLKRFKKRGVLYPLQTLSKNKKLDFSQVQLCTEAASPALLKHLNQFAASLSDHVKAVNSEQRLALHVAAVFACNFTNYLYAAAELLLKEHNLPFSMLHALIAETASKAQQLSPRDAQTGPAIRHDQTILKKHESFLKQHPDLRKRYKELSQAIQQLDATPHGRKKL